MAQTKVLRFTLFNLSGPGHGGDRRTAQLTELLESSGLSWQRIPDGMDPPGLNKVYFSRLYHIIILFFRLIFFIKKLPDPFRLYKTIKLTSQFTGIFNNINRNEHKLLIWEMTKSEYAFIVPLFKSYGYNILAVPHNLESLVPEQRSAISNRIAPLWRDEEFKVLALCDKVITISIEDSALLKNAGIDSETLPYFPASDQLKQLLDIRKERGTFKSVDPLRKKILMLGSAMNPPTRQGMKQVLELFRNDHFAMCDLVVAGYYTEQFAEYNSGERINIIGTVTDEKLHDLLCICDNALVCQPQTSGALTRICEFLIAGIPVISNIEAARSYSAVDGVYVYNNEEELKKFLTTYYPVPPVPQKPDREASFFVDMCLKYSK